MNDLKILSYELSDGYNKTTYILEILVQTIPTPTITSPINDITANVGITTTVLLTLSSDFDPSTPLTPDTLEVFEFGFNSLTYKNVLWIASSFLVLVPQSNPNQIKLFITPPFTESSNQYQIILKVTKGTTLST